MINIRESGDSSYIYKKKSFGMRRACFLFPALLILVVLVACDRVSRQRVAATLDDVESYINERPDSALAVLERVDSTGLCTRTLRARYSLLRVMARYKNYEDVTEPGLLDDAISYYARHGSADEKLKTYYYQGCIQQEKKDLNAAVIAFSQAEPYAANATDAHTVGLFYEAFSSIYNAVYNMQKELEYVEKSLDVWKRSGDTLYYSALGNLAYVYHTKKEWSKADSLYREAIAHSETYPHALSDYLSNYARMKLLQPEKDPAGAIELMNRKREISGKGLTPKEAGAFAYASELLGDKNTANALVARLQSVPESSRLDVLPWLARIAVFEGDMGTAYRYQAEMHVGEEEAIIERLTDSVTQSLQDHYAQEAQQERERKLRQGIWALGAVILLLVSAIVLLFRERRLRSERDRLVSIRASLEQDLFDQEVRAEALSSDLSSRVEQLRERLQRERLGRLRKSGRYGYWLWMEQNNRSSDKEVIKSLRKDLQEICTLEKDHRALERRLDQELDGLVSRLKADLELKSDEERFLCFWLIGLKADMIAELMNISTNNVYVKTYRLEERIRQLGKPEYLPLVKEKSVKA